MTSLEAFKKSQELDKNTFTLYSTTDGYMPIFNLYTSGFEAGANLYNTEKYEEALATFKNTGTVGEYIFSQGWGLYKLDTTITYYSALSAMNAKKEDEAVMYFQKLADANVGGSPENATSYRFLAKYYYDKKDEANMMKYINAGMALYPNDDYMPLLELDQIREKGDTKALFAKYEEILSKNPDNFNVVIDYATELFAETHVTEAAKRPADYEQRCLKIEALYKKAIELKPDSYEAKLSLGKHYYNQMLIMDEEVAKIKGTKPEDVKKKADMNAEIALIADKAIAPLEEVFKHFDTMGALKVGDRSNFKSACSLLSYSYDKKKDKAKSDFYYKKYDEADKAHK
jgi:tetratricopeptide (TPR) repeat protein